MGFWFVNISTDSQNWVGTGRASMKIILSLVEGSILVIGQMNSILCPSLQGKRDWTIGQCMVTKTQLTWEE